MDDYFPKDENDIIFHKNIYGMLKKISDDNSIPHVIFYGSPGCGKKTMLWLFLQLLFDNDVYDTQNISYEIVGSGGKIIKENVKQSNYHICIEPKNTNFDRYMIHDIVKEYAKRISLGVYNVKRSFRCVQINNLDNMSYYAQTALRRMIENYSNKCKFIMWCTSLSKIIKPLRSRCMCIRIPQPTKSELLTFLVKIAADKKIHLNYKDYMDIYNKSESNIKIALWELYIKQYDKSYKLDYHEHLENIINLIYNNAKNITPEIFHTFRNYIFNIMITNINGSNILRDLITIIIKSKQISDKQKTNIILISGEIDHKLNIGRREIIHFDLLFLKIVKILTTCS